MVCTFYDFGGVNSLSAASKSTTRRRKDKLPFHQISQHHLSAPLYSYKVLQNGKHWFIISNLPADCSCSQNKSKTRSWEHPSSQRKIIPEASNFNYRWEHLSTIQNYKTQVEEGCGKVNNGPPSSPKLRCTPFYSNQMSQLILHTCRCTISIIYL